MKMFYIVNYELFYYIQRAKAYCHVHTRTFHPAEEVKRYNPYGVPYGPLVIFLPSPTEITTVLNFKFITLSFCLEIYSLCMYP